MKATWPGRGTLVGVTRDFSDGGTFLEVRFEPPPPVGTEMELQLDALVDGGEAPVLRARVIRVTDEGIGFSFLGC